MSPLMKAIVISLVLALPILAGVLSFASDSGSIGLLFWPLAIFIVLLFGYSFVGALLPPAVRFALFPGQREWVSDFFLYLAQCVRRGFSPAEAISQRLDEVPYWLQRNVGRMLLALEAGEDIGNAAAAAHPLVSRADADVIAAATAAGHPADGLEYVGQATAARGLRNAPIWLIVVELLIFAGIAMFVMAVVVERMKDIYDQLGGELPFLTQSLIDISYYVLHYTHIVLVIAAAVILASLFLWKQPGLRSAISGLSPYLNGIYWSLPLSRFSAALGWMLRAQTPLPQALATAISASGNGFLKKKREEIVAAAASGQPLFVSLSKVSWLPTGYLWLVDTGSRNETLDVTLLEASDMLRRQHQDFALSLSAIFFPLLVLVTGLLIGVFVIALYLPLYYIPMLVGRS